MLTEPMPEGPGKGVVVHLNEMLPEYYKLRGWTGKGGSLCKEARGTRESPVRPLTTIHEGRKCCRPMGDNEFSYWASALGSTGFFTLVNKASFVMRGIITVGNSS